MGIFARARPSAHLFVRDFVQWEERAFRDYQQRAGSNSKNGNVNFGCDFERDQAHRRVLITRNLAELVRLNLDLVPIKGPREANWRRVHPVQTGSLTLISTSEHLPWLFPSSFFILPTRSPRSPCHHPFSRFISRSHRVLDELATAPGIDDVYGRMPVIGWSRFIDGRISRLERALWAWDARRGIPAAIPISGEFPRTLRLPFRNFRLRVTDLSESVVTRPRLSQRSLPGEAPFCIFRAIKHRILNTILLRT